MKQSTTTPSQASATTLIPLGTSQEGFYNCDTLRASWATAKVYAPDRLPRVAQSPIEIKVVARSLAALLCFKGKGVVVGENCSLRSR